MIINFDTWPPQSGARPYDVYNPEARDIYWKYLNKGIFSYIGNDAGGSILQSPTISTDKNRTMTFPLTWGLTGV